MKIQAFFISLLSILICQIAQAKIRIIIPIYNRPDFIELQAKGFEKFLQDDYEVLMFNDADNEGMRAQLEEECAKFGITCIRMPQDLHSNPTTLRASFRHGEVLQFAFENYGFNHDDIVTVIDSDMFLINNFSIRGYLGEYDLDGYGGGIMITHFGVFNMPKLKDKNTISFRARFLPDGQFSDVAYDTPQYIKDHPDLKMKNVNILWGIERDLHIDKTQDMLPQIQIKGYDQEESFLIKSIFDAMTQAIQKNPGSASRAIFDCDIGFYETNVFLDYKHGSGWHGPNSEMVRIKDALVKDFLSKRLN